MSAPLRAMQHMDVTTRLQRAQSQRTAIDIEKRKVWRDYERAAEFHQHAAKVDAKVRYQALHEKLQGVLAEIEELESLATPAATQ